MAIGVVCRSVSRRWAVTTISSRPPPSWAAAGSAAAIARLIARILQSLVHVGFAQTNAVASIRFAFFFVQIVAFLWLIGIVVARLA